jgi:hypothetical protein
MKDYIAAVLGVSVLVLANIVFADAEREGRLQVPMHLATTSTGVNPQLPMHFV